MALLTEDKQIGEHTFRVTQLTGIEGRKLFARLVRFVGPAIAGAVSSGRLKSLLDINLDVGSLMGQLADKFTDDELDFFCKKLGACTELVGDNGKTTKLDLNIQDVIFAGHLFDMFKWMAFALEVQFSDFLSELKRIQAAKSTAPASDASTSLPVLTGTSGES